MWRILSDVGFWAAIWTIMAASFGVVAGKCISVGMGTHSRSPFPDETITEGGSAQNETDDMVVLTEALERLESARPMNRSEWRRAS